MAMATTGSNSSSRHRGVHVELQHGVQLGLHLGRPPQHVPGRSPEHPAAADHRQLPDLLGGPVGEDEGDGDHKHGGAQARQRVGALRAADGHGGVHAGEEVVHHHGVAEVAARRHGRVQRPGAVHHLHGRLPRPAGDVVHVQPQPHREPTGRGRGRGRHRHREDES
uniref:Uncharacterized protein n=1 Tax=Oryza nivara TaxID=4536 RepID=A0A0E0FXX3_ORYNI